MTGTGLPFLTPGTFLVPLVHQGTTIKCDLTRILARDKQVKDGAQTQGTNMHLGSTVKQEILSRNLR